MRTPATYARNAGFTLLEMLAVVSILSVLLGIVLSAIHSAQNHTRRAVARSEVRSVESALKAYLDHYGNWSRLGDLVGEASGECGDRMFVIDGDLAAALEGTVAENEVARSANPDALPFIEFSRHLRVSEERRVPVNPWDGRKGAVADDRAREPSMGDARFWAAIDYDFDGVVDLKGLGLTDAKFHMPKARTFSTSSETTADDIDSVARPAVVWTYNPWTYDPAGGDRDEAVVSWME